MGEISFDCLACEPSHGMIHWDLMSVRVKAVEHQGRLGVHASIQMKAPWKYSKSKQANISLCPTVPVLPHTSPRLSLNSWRWRVCLHQAPAQTSHEADSLPAVLPRTSCLCSLCQCPRAACLGLTWSWQRWPVGAS